MYFVAVEIRDNPSLADKPVAVGDKVCILCSLLTISSGLICLLIFISISSFKVND